MSDSPRPPISIHIDDELSNVVRLGLVRAAPVAIGPSNGPLLEAIDLEYGTLAQRHGGRSPGSIDELKPARELYRAFGIDPTRHRPSSEALLRRILKGKPFPRISNAVDLCNLFAVRFLLPLGLYDAERLSGSVTLRRGEAGEAYEGIRKDSIHLEGRPVLVDSAGPFGNPTSDSLRTSVTDATRDLWMVIFAPSRLPSSLVEAHVRTSREEIARYLVGPDGAVITDGSVQPLS